MEPEHVVAGQVRGSCGGLEPNPSHGLTKSSRCVPVFTVPLVQEKPQEAKAFIGVVASVYVEL